MKTLMLLFFVLTAGGAKAQSSGYLLITPDWERIGTILSLGLYNPQRVENKAYCHQSYLDIKVSQERYQTELQNNELSQKDYDSLLSGSQSLEAIMDMTCESLLGKRRTLKIKKEVFNKEVTLAPETDEKNESHERVLGYLEIKPDWDRIAKALTFGLYDSERKDNIAFCEGAYALIQESFEDIQAKKDSNVFNAREASLLIHLNQLGEQSTDITCNEIIGKRRTAKIKAAIFNSVY